MFQVKKGIGRNAPLFLGLFTLILIWGCQRIFQNRYNPTVTRVIPGQYQT